MTTFLAALLALSLLVLAGALARRSGSTRLAPVPVPARLRRASRSGRRRHR